MRMRQLRHVALGLAIGLTHSVAGAHAQTAHVPSLAPTLHQFHHTAWTTRDGAPANVVGLAQTTDGALWLGTPMGLYRYDGVRFERYVPSRGARLPSENIAALSAFPDGSLWIGYRFGGVSVVRGDRIVSYGQHDGLPPGSIDDIVRDSTGVTWAATTTGLRRLDGDRWRTVGAEDGFAGGVTTALLVDRRGTLWATSLTGLFARPRGTQTFVRRGTTLGYGNGGALREAPDGSVWGGSMDVGLTQLTDAHGASVVHVSPPRADTIVTMLIGNDGDVSASRPGQLARMRLHDGQPTGQHADAAAQQMTRVDGLSGNTVITLLQDREGSVWVGTESGLDRFRVTKMTPVLLPQPLLGPTIVPGDSGTMWVGSSTQPLLHIGERVTVRPDVPAGVESAYRDAGGTVWLGSARGMWHSSGPAFVPVTLPSGVAGSPIQSIARDGAGRVWLSIVRRGLFRHDTTGAWIALGARWDRAGQPAITMIADSAGRMWLGYAEITSSASTATRCASMVRPMSFASAT